MQSIKKILASNSITTISLFSGAGGLDIGAIYAGAKIIWANDIKKEVVTSYSHNIGEHIIHGDINDFIPSLAKYRGRVDLVVGGPPCQGFSVAGKMDKDDERNKQIWSFVNVIEIVKPKAFIMENVKALVAIARWASIKNALMEKFRKLGYSVNYVLLNASDFDVPQARERVFFIGFTDNSPAKPDLMEMIKPYRHESKTVREALSVLDRAGVGNNRSVCNARITLAPNPVMRKSPYAGMLFNGLGRPLRIDGYSATLPASMGGNKTPIIDEAALYDNKRPWIEHYHERVSANPSIAKTETIPSTMRRLTVDEARVLQTFPLEYKFYGSQCAQYAQIGNAVPCNLAKAVCSMVIDVLNFKIPILYPDAKY